MGVLVDKLHDIMEKTLMDRVMRDEKKIASLLEIYSRALTVSWGIRRPDYQSFG